MSLPPKLPPKPKNMENGDLGSVPHDFAKQKMVFATLEGTTDTYTVAIRDVAAPGRVLPDGSPTPTNSSAQMFSFEVHAVTLTLHQLDPSETPPGHKPITVWDETVTATSKDSTPIRVNDGQRLVAYATVKIADPFLLPGKVTGTLALQGTQSSITVPLSVVFLAVDPRTAIGKRWRAMGGEAFFGLAQSNEKDDLLGPGVHQIFERGVLYQTSGNPVRFFTPECFSKWGGTTSLGDPVAPALGIPLGDTFLRPDGVQVQIFQFGAIVVRAGSQFVVMGAIYEDYLSVAPTLTNPSADWPLGFPLDDEQAMVGGRAQQFDKADYDWTPATGAHYLNGEIRNKWSALGGAGSSFGWVPGLPTSDPASRGAGQGAFQRFQNGMIFWHPAASAHEVHGEILKRYAQLDLEQSHLGYPTADEQAWTNPANGRAGRISTFQHGQIGWTPQDGTIDLPPESVTLQQIVSPPAGDGWANVTLRSDGTYTVTTHIHNSGLDTYAYQIRIVLRTSKGVQFLWQHADKVSGTTGSGDRNSDFSESGFHDWIRASWPEARTATMDVARTFDDVGIGGVAEQILKDALSFLVVDVIAGPTIGLVVILGQKLTAATGVSVGPGALPGVIVAAGTAWLLGPGLVFPALAAGVAAGALTDALIQFRRMTDVEIRRADDVFQGKVPYDKIWLTNLSNGGNAFTWPSTDGNILVNLGDAFADPIKYKDTPDSHYPKPGQKLIHELTHAWQIAHAFFPPGLACKRIGDPSYSYGPLGPPFSSFTVEGQASLVDEWYGGTQSEYWIGPPKNLVLSPENKDDPRFPYIENNIRTGQG